jgi:hypothetical protein
MNPRPGGEADKFGNRYEGAWTVARLLEVIGGQVNWVRVEPVGDLGRGIEFVLERADGTVEVHQVKRQSADANEWNFGMLSRLGIWDAARTHSAADREYHFVSMVPFRRLQDLTERARNSNDIDSFIFPALPRKLEELFNQTVLVYGDQRTAFSVLRSFRVRLIDESEIQNSNAVIAEVLLEGGTGSLIRAALGELVDSTFDMRLDSARLLTGLRSYGIHRRLTGSREGLAERVRSHSAAWAARVEQQLIKPSIHRDVSRDLINIPSARERVHFLVGTAGGGKTAVLQQAVTGLVDAGVPTLAIRLDRYGTLSSTADLGRHLDLDVSPVAALAASANGDPAVLVVDQLDAVSLVSGRLTENFDVVVDLVNEAAAIPGLHVILACRQFDVENDHRIRSLRDRLEAPVVAVTPLTDQQVQGAVTALGLPAQALTQPQREILRLPLHLSLLATVANDAGSLHFKSSQRLFDAYWEHKRRAALNRRDGVRFGEVVGLLATAISERQELAVPVRLLDENDLAEDASTLVSEQILVRDGSKIAFFHEAVFDYAFARQWIGRGQTLVDFLTESEQELFRRGQVRQIMAHLRAEDSRRFLNEVSALLGSADIRYHIKDAALAVLANLDDPSSDEASMLMELAGKAPQTFPRILSRLQPQAWFERLERDGYLHDWISGQGALQQHALYLMSGIAMSSPDRVSEILTQHAAIPSYATCLRTVARMADLGASRSLFDLVVDGVKHGYFNGHEQTLWLTLHGLPKRQPDWAVEVLAAFLVERPEAMTVGPSCQVVDLKIRDHHAVRFAKEASSTAPRAFCETMVPILLRVMALTAHEGSDRPVHDHHFSHRLAGPSPDTDLGAAIFKGVAKSLQVLAAKPSEVLPVLEQLASDPHESAQWLLYKAIAANGQAHAAWAATLLLEGRHRLECGYTTNPVWQTRLVLTAISTFLSEDLFIQVEDEIRDFTFSWERRPHGFYAFTLLSGLDPDRLSPSGRLRLGELRRLFAMDEPLKPEGITGGSIGSPIPRHAAIQMNDENWLRAMTTHSGDREALTRLVGGASELAQVLQEVTKEDPRRFAALALRLTPDFNPVYAAAILRGLGEAGELRDEETVFRTILHVASFRHSEIDRFLGSALQPYLRVAPISVVELIVERLTIPAEARSGQTDEQDNDRNALDAFDLEMYGINTAKGSLAETMANLLSYDLDGSRTAVVVPALSALAEDPSIPVRTAVARLIGAAMRLAMPAAKEAFWRLLNADDALLKTTSVFRILAFLVQLDAAEISPVIDRMLASDDEEVREAGGKLAVLAATEAGISHHLEHVMEGTDTHARKGAAGSAAHRLPHTDNLSLAARTLEILFFDVSDDVRREAAQVAGALHGWPLGPFEGVLKTLIASPAFKEAAAQLLLTIESAPGRVNSLIVLTATSFVEQLGREASDISMGTAADARDIGQLVIRGLAQTRSAEERAIFLDVLDQLLFLDAYGIQELVNEVER